MTGDPTPDRKLQLLAQLGVAMLEHHDLGVFFQRAVASIAAAFEVELCKILELVPGRDEDRLLLRAGVGWDEGLVGVAHVEGGLGSQAGYTLASADPVVVEELASESRFSGPALLREHGVVSGVSAVIGSRRAPFEVLGLHTRRRRRFTDAEVELVATLATTLAAVIELERAQGALQLRERAIESVHNGIIITDATQPDNPIIYVNRAFTEMTGYAREEAIGRNCRFLQGDGPRRPEEAFDQLREAIRHGREVQVEIANRRRDGSEFWLELFVSPVRDERGILTHFVGVQNDISKRKQLEDQMLQAQRMEAIGQLAGGVAHDFNTLLGTIQGYSEMLLEDLPRESPLRTAADQIHRCAARGAGLTRQLLTFSRQHVARPEDLRLDEVVKGMQGMLRRLIGEDIELVFSIVPGVPPIFADRGNVEQILMNLVVNSADAMPTGGRLAISTVCDRLADDGSGEGGWAGLVVADTGSGMDEETLKHAFEPFFTTKEPGKGTGLGLATVYGIVEEAGGSIAVDSAPGEGTEVRISFPIARSTRPAAETVADADDTPASGGSERVFLVEDDEMFRALLTQILRRNGYQVVAAADPIQATAIRQQLTEPIDLLITDMVMPGGSGRDLAEQFARHYAEMKVILMSGYTDEDLARRGGAEIEHAEFIPKPFSTHELLLKVREVLER